MRRKKIKLREDTRKEESKKNERKKKTERKKKMWKERKNNMGKINKKIGKGKHKTD